LKDNLSAYLAEVRGGEEILVRDRNVPIARLVPLGAAAAAGAELAALAVEGKVRLPKKALPHRLWRTKAPRVSEAKVLEVLRADRDSR